MNTEVLIIMLGLMAMGVIGVYIGWEMRGAEESAAPPVCACSEAEHS